MADRKENEMPSGYPAKIRALDSSGNSISPTMEEFSSSLPLQHTAYGVVEINGYTVFAECNVTFVGSLNITMGTQDSSYNNYWAMLYIMAMGGVPVVRINSLITNSVIVKYYYKVEGGKLLIAAKDMSSWNHVSTTSFCERIIPVFRKITSIDGWTPIN